MPTFNKKKEKKSNSKKGLGRGLGSLLPTETFHFGHSRDSLSFAERGGVSDLPDSLSGRQKQRTSGDFSKPADTLSNREKSNNYSDLSDSGKILHLPVEKLVPNQSQPRKDFSKEALKELSLSIKEQGLLQPITVKKRGNRFEIIAGERRFRASQMAGLKEVPVILKDNVSHQKSVELALIENLQREDLNILEEALGYQFLIDNYHLSQKELAFKMGKKRSSIANVLRILTLPEDIKEMLKGGALSLGHAKVLLSVSDSKKQSQLAREVLGKNLSVRALEGKIGKEGSEESKRVQSGAGETLITKWIPELAAGFQKILGTKVSIQYRKGRGQVNIAFYSDEELSQLYERIKNP